MKQPVGVLKRLNVGVVLDDWQKVDADGKATTAPMSDTDIKRFTELIKDSIGLKEDRGDQLNVLNQAFKSSVAIGPVDAPPLWQQPWASQLAKQITGAALVLIVAFLVLRPLMKSLTKPAGRLSATVVEDIEGDRVSLSAQGKPIKLSPSFRAADSGGTNLGGTGSTACGASRKGLGLRGWLTRNSPERSAPPSCS